LFHLSRRLNYLDIYGREQVEHLILMFQPAMIIEHDNIFQNKIYSKKISLDLLKDIFSLYLI